MMLINPYVYTSTSVKFLGHFDGTNGATAFVDSSGNNVTITTVDTAQLSTSIKKFGTASLYLPAATAYTTIPSTVANFAGKDFCIELWVYLITKNGFGNILGHNIALNSYVGFNLQWDYSTNKIRFLSGHQGAGIWAVDAMSAIDVPLNAWSHIAITRQGQILRVFINGVKAIEVNSAATLWAESNSGYFGIGAGFGNNRFGVGYIDEVRIIEGNAVYTTDFTPPTSPF
jgi:hypothetical protein